METVLFDWLALTRLSERNLKPTLEGCGVQTNSLHNKFEVVIKNYTNINKSSKKFHVGDLKVQRLASYLPWKEVERVTFQAQVLKVNEQKLVGSGICHYS